MIGQEYFDPDPMLDSRGAAAPPPRLSPLQELAVAIQDLQVGMAEWLATVQAQIAPGGHPAPQPPTAVVRLPAGEAGRHTGPALPLPEKYTGDPNQCCAFLMQLMLHFLTRPTMYAADQDRVAFLIGNMGAEARDWATPHVEDDSPLLRDYEGFMSLFRQTFERRRTRQAMKAELLEITQGNWELSAYVAHFQRLASSTTWTEDTKDEVLYRCLKEELKDAIATVVTRPETVSGLVDLALQLEQRLSDRKEECRKIDHRRPTVRIT